jgi:VanZ family protein
MPHDLSMSSSASSPRRSALHYFLASVCVFVIVYVSIEPFQGWSAPHSGALSLFVRRAGLRQFFSFDTLVNVLAYVPLGFALCGVVKRKTVAVFAAFLLSLGLELAQAFLPTRHASIQDTTVNTLGAWLGAQMFELFTRTPSARRAAQRLRAYVLPGVRGDYGLVVLLAFLLAHLSPGLSFFSSTFFVHIDSNALEPGLQLLQVLHTALMMTGFGLFADLVAKTRLAGALLSMGAVLFAIGSKTLLAMGLLQPSVWGLWLSPTVVMGLLIGAVSLIVIFWMSAAEKRIVCNVVLIVAVLLPALAPEWLFARVPVRAFDWNYGHLLNFNTLSQTLLRLWPLFASAYLLSTAGNPYQDPPPKSK